MIKILSEHEKVSNGKIYCDLCGFRIPKGKPYIEQINVDEDDPNGEEYAFNMHKCCQKLASEFDNEYDRDSFWEAVDNETFNSDRIRAKILKAVMDEYGIDGSEIDDD